MSSPVEGESEDGGEEGGRRESECAKDEGKKGGRSGYLSISTIASSISVYLTGPEIHLHPRECENGLLTRGSSLKSSCFSLP